jgi:hypothetical protein
MFISGERVMEREGAPPSHPERVRGRVDNASACQRVRGEYLEMPGVRLTAAQAARLFGLEPQVCGDVLAILVAERFLGRTQDGRFVRRGACPRCE